MAKLGKYSVLLFVALAVACNPSRRAERLVDKAMRINAPAVVKKVTPAVITERRVVKDTARLIEFVKVKEEIIRRADSLTKSPEATDCEGIKRKLADANEFIDGLQSLLDNLPVVTDTIYQADTGRVWLAEYNLGIANRDIMEERAKRVRDLRLGFFGLLLIVLSFLFLYLFRRK